MPVVVLSWTPSNLASEQERPRHAAQRAMRIQVVSDLHLEFHNLLLGVGAKVYCGGDCKEPPNWLSFRHSRPMTGVSSPVLVSRYVTERITILS